MSSGPWAGDPNPTIDAVEPILADGRTVGWCFAVKPDGFVVVPALKELPPVKCFSENGCPEFDEQQGIGGLLRDALQRSTTRFEAAYGDVAATPAADDGRLFGLKNRDAWAFYAQSPESFKAAIADNPELGSKDEVGPMLTTAWHQGSPYNRFCPVGDGGRTVVWCVATALAQIMYYHQWPPAGFGHNEYQWDGDQSCEGTSPGLYLAANFSDRYGYSGSTYDIAELCAEVGRAYDVDYGVCYSIGWVEPVIDFLPEWFGYKDVIEELFRADFEPEDWFDLVVREINAGRPIQYLIFNHMIVADGWRTQDNIDYYHMNYGWANGANAWYAIDQLLCTWEGCDPMEERMYARIEPDRSIMFYADTIIGNAPLTVQFTGMSDTVVDTWSWDFGDGDTAAVQNPEHTFAEAGVYDVSLSLGVGDTTIARTRTAYMHVLADSLWFTAGEVVAGSTLVVTVEATNALPLTEIQLPIQFAGALELVYDSFSVAGCRTESCQAVTQDVADQVLRRLHFEILPWESGESTQPYMEAGGGTLLKLYFTVDPEAGSAEQATLSAAAFGGGVYRLTGTLFGQSHEMDPTTKGLVVTAPYLGCCVGLRGNVDVDPLDDVSLGDLTVMIDHLFVSFADLECWEEANLDASQPEGPASVSLGDLTVLIDILFVTFADPLPCP